MSHTSPVVLEHACPDSSSKSARFAVAFAPLFASRGACRTLLPAACPRSLAGIIRAWTARPRCAFRRISRARARFCSVASTGAHSFTTHTNLPARARARARSRRFRLVFADSATVASISPPAVEPAETFDRSATSASSTTLPPAPPKRAAAPAPGDPVPDSPKSVDATPSDPCPRIPAQHEATANATAVVANSFELRPRWCANCSHCFFATSSRTSWFCSGECLYSYSVQCYERQVEQEQAAQQGHVDMAAGSHGLVVRPRPDFAGFSSGL